MQIGFPIFFMLSLITAYFIYSILNHLDVFKSHHLHHDSSCKTIPITLPSEDLVVFGSFVIGASADYLSLFYKHLSANEALPGHLFTFHQPTQLISLLPILNFPESLSFNPHGIYLYSNSTLYVLSHGFSKGGDNVFVIELSEKDGKIEAQFVKRIYLGHEHGIYNSLVVLSSEYFYITQWIPVPFHESGRDTSFIFAIKNTFFTLFSRSNGIKVCQVRGETAICSIKAFGYMPNGITKLNNHIFVADSITHSVNIYLMKAGYELELVETVKFSHSVDNMFVKGEVIYVTGIEKAYEFILFVEEKKAGEKGRVLPSGTSKMWRGESGWVSEEVIMQEKLSFATAAVIINNDLILSSCVDSFLLVCPQ